MADLDRGAAEFNLLLAEAKARIDLMAHPSRDQLAAMAMQGLLAHDGDTNDRSDRQLARAAYQIADAMIAERAKGPSDA